MAESGSKSGSLAKVFQKRVVRTKEKVLQNLGKADRTTDDVFNEHATNFKRQEASANKLHKELKNYVQCVKDMSSANRHFYLAVKEAYEPDWMGYQEVERAVESLNFLWEDYLEKLVQSVQTPLHSYTSRFPDTKQKISKRGRKLVDYDHARHNHEQLHQSKKRDEAKILRSQEELREARRVYEELNTDLHMELPALYESRIDALSSTFHTLFLAEAKFAEETSKDYWRLKYALMGELADLSERLSRESGQGGYRPAILTSPVRDGELNDSGAPGDTTRGHSTFYNVSLNSESPEPALPSNQRASATESSGAETSPSTVISPDDAPSNQAAVTNGDLSDHDVSGHVDDVTGHVEESTYEPVSVGAQGEPVHASPPVAPSLPPANEPPSTSPRSPPVDPAGSSYRTFLHYDMAEGPHHHPVILTSKDFNEEAFDQRQRERMAEIAADQERAMYASREVDKRQRVVATELMQLEQQRRQVQSELRGLQKQQRMVEDEFGEIERQQRAIEAKLLEMQLRQKQVEYETQLKEMIYEANTPVGMSYVRQLPRQRSVPRHVGRSATPDTLRSYDSAGYVLERPHSAQMERRYLPGAGSGSLHRGDGVPPSGRRIKRSSSLKKLFSSLGRSKEKQRDQYGDVDTTASTPKKPGVLRSLKKKVNSATYSFYEAQKPYETVKFKKNKDASGGATAYTDSQPGTPTGRPPKALHGKDANKPGGINIVRSNQQVNAAAGASGTPLKITEKKSYMVEESTDYLRKTYLPREEFAVTETKAEFGAPGAGEGARPESLISVKEDTITPRLVKQHSREEAVKDAMSTLERQEKDAKDAKKTLKEEAEAAQAQQDKEGQGQSKDGVKVIVTAPEVDPKIKKETAAKEARLMKIASGAETPKQQSVDKMESLEKMTNDDGQVGEKYEKCAENDAKAEKSAEDDFGKWKVKRMDKVDIDMPSAEVKSQGQTDDKKKDEGQGQKEAEKPKEGKITSALNQAKSKVEEAASDAKAAVQSARFKPAAASGSVAVKKNEAPAPPPATSGADVTQQPAGITVSQQPANQQQQQQPATNQQQPAAPSIEQGSATTPQGSN